VSRARLYQFRHLPVAQRITLAITALSVLWTLSLLFSSGIDVSFLGLRVRSHRWSDPALVAVVSALAFAWLRRRSRPATDQAGGRIAATTASWFRTPGNLLLIAILVIAAIARFWALTFGLPHPAARPDEEAVSAMAGGYYRGFFEQTDFTYPPLYILAVAATLWLVFRKLPATLGRMNIRLGLSDPSTAAQRTVARFLSAVAGVVSVWLLFRIGTRLFGRPTGLVAAAFLALAFLHVRDSHFGVTDIPMSCMVLVGFLAIVKLSESGSHRDLVSAGIFTGLAVATKYNAALLVLPASFAILYDPLQRPIPARLVRILAFGAMMTAAFLIVCPYSVLRPGKFLADLASISQHLSGGHGSDLGRGWIYHLTTTLRYGLGVPLLAAGLAGFPLMVWREGRRGILVALFPVAYYALTGSGRTVFARYILPAVPFLCLTAGYFIVILAGAVSNYLRRPAWRVAMTTLMTVAVLWPSLLSVIAFDRLIAREDSRVIARRWIESRFAPGTTIGQIALSIGSSGHLYINYETDYQLSDPTTSRPTLIVVVSSPLGGPNPDRIPPWVEREYELRFTEHVIAEEDRANIYDQQDDFYVPLAGFHQIERPGPNVRIYVRRGTPVEPVTAARPH
jgi:hypothetical protein